MALVWAGCTGATFWLASLTAPNLPKFDEWMVFVPALTGSEPITWEWLWRQVNEHRVFLPRLAYMTSVSLTGDFRAGAFLNVAILAAVAGAGMRTAVRQRGIPRIRDAFFPLILLHWGQTHLFLLGIALNFTITIALAYLATFTMIGSTPAELRRTAVVVTLCAVGMVVSSLMGVLIAFALVVWLLGQSWLLLRGGPSERRDGRLLIVLAMLILAAMAFYFWHFHPVGRPPATAPEPRSLGDRVTMMFVLLAMSLGWLGRLLGPAAGVVVACIALGVGGVTAQRVWRSPREGGIGGLLALSIGSGLVLVGLASGRAQISGEALWATTRYATLSIPFLVVAYFFAGDSGRMGALVQRTLAVLALVVFVGPLIPAVHYPYAQEFLRMVAGDEQVLLGQLRAGVDSEVAAREFFRHQNNYDAHDGARWIDMLRRSRLGPFADHH